MYKLQNSYGKHSYDEWLKRRPTPKSLADTQTSPEQADDNPWPVKSYRELVEAVAFLAYMNKRQVLFFRGQVHDHPPMPMLFRSQWSCFASEHRCSIVGNRRSYWEHLLSLGQTVYEVCTKSEFGLPRWRGLRDIREVQWAVIQHYELWPTPLIDLTSSLRVAASFALDFTKGTNERSQTGYVYVIGLPHSTGSITFDIDEHFSLARLNSACPPIAKRPHYQEGFLLGRFPLYNVGDDEPKFLEKSHLNRRLIVKFELNDTGSFWDDDFPMFNRAAMYVNDDPLRNAFKEIFGLNGEHSISNAVNSIR